MRAPLDRTRATSVAVTLATVLAAGGEGVVAGARAASAEIGPRGILGAAVGAFALVAAAAALPAVSVIALARARGAERLARGLASGLGGRHAHAGAAILVGAATAAAAVVVAARAGGYLSRLMTAPFAALGEAMVCAAAIALGLLVGSTLGDLVAAALTRVGIGPGRLAAPAGLALLAVATAIAARSGLPEEYAVAPALGLAGLSVGALDRARSRAPLRWLGRPAVVLGLGALGAITAFAAIPRLPVGARATIAYRTPFAGPLLERAWALVDHDADGYSPILGGGDCDDARADVHPTAPDVPDDGIDQDCSGFDAHAYVAPPAPPYELPRSLEPQTGIVLVFFDALRPDHLGFNGYGRNTSPNLDRFRAGATLFERAYTPAPSTRFAMAGLFTGRDPRELPHTDLGGNEMRLDPDATTIAEILRGRGFDTTGYAISYVVHHNPGAEQGFREWRTPWPVNDWARSYRTAARQTTDAALASLAHQPAGSRYFLFLHYRCTHDPYMRYPEWDFGARPVDLYDSSLAYCDSQIERVIEALDARTDRDHTTIVMLSDHGELFGEHGLTNHGNSLFEPDVRVLLMARVPGIHVRTVHTPVSLTDVVPTLLELVGARQPANMTGRSLLGPMIDESPGRARPLFIFTRLLRGNVQYRASGVVDWPYKLIRDERTSDFSLYDVATEPAETHDLSTELPDVRSRTAELLESYDAHVAEVHR